MQFLGDIFNNIFLAPVVNVLIWLMHLMESIGLSGALGWAIVAMTLLIRFLVWPLIGAQLRSAKKMVDLKPQLDVLKKKHGKDKQAYALAQAKLFKEEGYNPAAGCLPSLIQIPVLIALYQAISSLFNGQSGLDHINYFLYPFVEKLTQTPDPYFLGFNLSAKPSDFATAGAVVLLVPVITALTQFLQSKMLLPQKVKEYPSDSPKEKKEKEDFEDTMAGMQTQMTYMMPLMIAYFAFTFPIGLAVYWNLFSLLGIWQQHRIYGWGGLQSWVNRLAGKTA